MSEGSLAKYWSHAYLAALRVVDLTSTFAETSRPKDMLGWRDSVTDGTDAVQRDSDQSK